MVDLIFIGYVQLTGLKIDFSSDVEHTEKPKKKRKRVKCTPTLPICR